MNPATEKAVAITALILGSLIGVLGLARAANRWLITS